MLEMQICESTLKKMKISNRMTDFYEILLWVPKEMSHCVCKISFHFVQVSGRYLKIFRVGALFVDRHTVVAL